MNWEQRKGQRVDNSIPSLYSCLWRLLAIAFCQSGLGYCHSVAQFFGLFGFTSLATNHRRTWSYRGSFRFCLYRQNKATLNEEKHIFGTSSKALSVLVTVIRLEALLLGGAGSTYKNQAVGSSADLFMCKCFNMTSQELLHSCGSLLRLLRSEEFREMGQSQPRRTDLSGGIWLLSLRTPRIGLHVSFSRYLRFSHFSEQKNLHNLDVKVTRAFASTSRPLLKSKTWILHATLKLESANHNLDPC